MPILITWINIYGQIRCSPLYVGRLVQIETGELPLRPSVARLVDEARAAGVTLAVCSTSNEKAVSAVVNVMLGPERAKDFEIYAGDMVPKKKPDPVSIDTNVPVIFSVSNIIPDLTISSVLRRKFM